MAEKGEIDRDHIVLGLLDSLERDGTRSQRHIAAELGIALGLVNSYLKRCVNKGLVKMSAAPARRYAYYLTPKGFAEKSRLTVDYLSYSFSFFRRARADCSAALTSARASGCKRVALLGVSDLAEIATICAFETGTTIAAVVDPKSSLAQFGGFRVLTSIDPAEADAFLVTDLTDPHATTAAAIAKFGADRVLIPVLLGVRVARDQEGAA